MAYPQKGECRNTGRTHFKKGQVSINKGKKASPELRRKMSDAHKGHTPWNQGKKLSKDVRKKMSLVKRGQNNQRWLGGITTLNHAIRNLFEYREWKLSVYKKYKSICQGCGHKSHKNHAHHIKPFAIILKEMCQNYSQFSIQEDKDTLVRLAITYEPFWDINNGTVLCKECHADVD